MGHLSGASWSEVSVVAVLVPALTLVLLAYARDLNVLLLGETDARALGVEAERSKRALLAVSSVLTGVAVAVSGVIGFVGLIVPHAVRLLVGPDHRILLPTSALAGGLPRRRRHGRPRRRRRTPSRHRHRRRRRAVLPVPAAHPGGVRPVSDDRSSDPEDCPMIAVRDLVVSRGGERVLDGVSLSVDRGELVGLVGPNGAGKTTLVAAVNGTLTPEAGTVELDGTDRSTLSQREVARLVATVPQESNTAFEFSVEAVVEMGRTAYVSRFGTTTEADRAAVERAMDRAGVTAFADRPVTTLSGGERQRVLFARALAGETPGLLLDEPTASLDINHQLRTLELVREVVDDGKAALAAIHDLNLAARVCDRLVLLAGGRIRATGTPREVLGDDALADAFGVRTAVNDDPAVGSPMVTALRDDES